MRKLLLILSLLFISFSIYSQNSKLKFGVQAGLNYATLWGYDLPSYYEPFYKESPDFGFLAGLSCEYKIKEKLSLRVELSYERKTQKSDKTIYIEDISYEPQMNTLSGETEFTTKKNYNYLVLPIMLKYNFKDSKSFYLNGGPFIGFLLQSNLTNNLDPRILGLNNESKTMTTKNNNLTDIGFSLGFGKTFDINPKSSIFIELRDNIGLVNTSKFKAFGNGTYKTNSLNLIVGYTFGR
jgi:Outer membrane protein beta-barrel domain